MTTIKQIKGLAKNLLDKNIDLAAAGRNSFWLLPIESIGRLIHLDRTSNPAYCVASWYLVEFFMPGVRSSSSLGRCSERIARSEGFEGGQGWFWSDPTIYDDFLTRVEADALAILRPLDTTRKCLDFARTRPATVGRLGLDWHLVACIALGELDEARTIWSKIGKHYRNGAVMEGCALAVDQRPDLPHRRAAHGRRSGRSRHPVASLGSRDHRRKSPRTILETEPVSPGGGCIGRPVSGRED